MNEIDDKLVVMHRGQVSKDRLFKKYEENILAALTSRRIAEYRSYLASLNTKYVCFDKIMLGGQLTLFDKRSVAENVGREQLLFNWRSRILEYHQYDPFFVPKHHHIVITNKSYSLWTGNKTGRRNILNLDDVVTFVKTTYPNITVDTIEWHKVSFSKQLAILLNTTILISPCGGVSMNAPFLPIGSSAIIMDYYVTDPTIYQFKPGSSASMEGSLHNHFSHYRKLYYQVYGPQDYVFDVTGTNDTRNLASIMVNMSRLHLLLETAFET